MLLCWRNNAQRKSKLALLEEQELTKDLLNVRKEKGEGDRREVTALSGIDPRKNGKQGECEKVKKSLHPLKNK